MKILYILLFCVIIQSESNCKLIFRGVIIEFKTANNVHINMSGNASVCRLFCTFTRNITSSEADTILMIYALYV